MLNRVKVLPDVGENARIEIETKPQRWYTLILRGLSVVSGIFVVLASVALMFTIIGILPGLPLFIIGGGLVGTGLFVETKVACPYCQYKMNVRVGSLNVRCRKCRRLTVTDWRRG